MAFSILMRLEWLKPGAPARKAFRLPGAGDLFDEYTGRLRRYSPFEATGSAAVEGMLWDCDPRGKVLSSEALAEKLREARDGGVKILSVRIGGPDGLSKGGAIPSLRWSFGAMTLPHELAAVVAAEQLYRAWTILGNEPYHLGH
jgi:23S rRNA (pseudouridine1915-N3)-methyltransferase